MRKEILLFALLLAGCQSGTSAPAACDGQTACESVDVAEEQVQMQEITFDQAIQLFEDGEEAILYFGFTDCPWCQQARPVLEEALEESGTSLPVLYVRTRDDQRNRLYTDEQKERIIPYIGDYMSDNEDGELTLYVPLVLNVSDGRVVAGHESTLEGHDAKERELTEEEKEELKQTYLALIQKQ